MKAKNKIYATLGVMVVLGIATIVFAATVTKGIIGKQDLALWYQTDSSKTFTRASSGGYTLTLHKMDWVGVDALAVYGGGVNANDTTLSSALTGIGTSADVKLFLAPTAWAIDDDLTITENITMVIPAGAVLTVASGKTLTIHGPVEVGSYQVFAGSGDTKFGLGTVTYARNPLWLNAAWFGFLPYDPNGDAIATQSTTNKTAMDRAIASIPEPDTGRGVRTIRVPPGLYYVDPFTITKDSLTLEGMQAEFHKLPSEGMSQYGTTLSFAYDGGVVTDGDETGILYGLNADNDAVEGVTIRRMQIAGNGTCGNGIDFRGSGALEELNVHNFTSAAVYNINPSVNFIIDKSFLTGSLYGLHIDKTAANSTNLNISRTELRNNTYYGAYLESAWGTTFRNCIIESNYREGLYMVRDDDTSISTRVTIDKVWFENNNREDRTGVFYEIFMDDETQATLGGFSHTTIKESYFNPTAISGNITGRGSINIQCGFDTQIIRSALNSTGIAYAIEQGSSASFVVVEQDAYGGVTENTFNNEQGLGSVLKAVRKASSTRSAGYEIIGDVHTRGGRTQTYWYTIDTVTAGTSTLMRPTGIYGTSGAPGIDALSYPTLKSGSVVGLMFMQESTLDAGRMWAWIHTRPSWGGTKTDMYDTGAHDGGNNEATIMTDSGEAFTADEYIGRYIVNDTDSSSGLVLDNDTTTITVGALTGGTDDDWDTGDVWYIIDYVTMIRGRHSQSDGKATLGDTNKAWTASEFVNRIIKNITDGSQCVITSNTTSKAVCVLSGGTDDDWDLGDYYEIYEPVMIDSNDAATKSYVFDLEDVRFGGNGTQLGVMLYTDGGFSNGRTSMAVGLVIEF